MFLLDIMAKISKSPIKTSLLLGDFNSNLLEADDHNDTSEFYEILSMNTFRPLILQPTRVTSKSAILIDNICVNNLEVFSFGGNITTGISDHFPQFLFLDIREKTSKT